MGYSHPSKPDLSALKEGAIVIGRRDDKKSFMWWAYRVGEMRQSPNTGREWPVSSHYWVPKEGRWLIDRTGVYQWGGTVIGVYADPEEGQGVIDVLQSTYEGMWEARRQGENSMRVALKLMTQ